MTRALRFVFVLSYALGGCNGGGFFGGGKHDAGGDSGPDAGEEDLFCESPSGGRDCASIVRDCGLACGTDRRCAQGCLDEARDLPECAEALRVLECTVEAGEAGGACETECADYRSGECTSCLGVQCTSFNGCLGGGV